LTQIAKSVIERRLLLEGLQVALARQDVKERESSEDITGKRHVMRGVPLKEVLEVVVGPPKGQH
jgi:hypothetical protein